MYKTLILLEKHPEICYIKLMHKKLQIHTIYLLKMKNLLKTVVHTQLTQFISLKQEQYINL